MKKLFAAVFAVLLAVTVCSCGAAADEGELFDALSSLAPRAREIYEIVYGDSLEHEISAGSDGYYAVSATAKYQSISELKAEISGIFSTGYSEILYNTAFYGVSSDEAVINAKFIEKEERLYVNPGVTEGFGKPREFDLSNMQVVKSNRFRAILTVTDGENEFQVSMQKENGVWKIDSALF